MISRGRTLHSALELNLDRIKCVNYWDLRTEWYKSEGRDSELRNVGKVLMAAIGRRCENVPRSIFVLNSETENWFRTCDLILLLNFFDPIRNKNRINLISGKIRWKKNNFRVFLQVKCGRTVRVFFEPEEELCDGDNSRGKEEEDKSFISLEAKERAADVEHESAFYPDSRTFSSCSIFGSIVTRIKFFRSSEKKKGLIITFCDHQGMV